MWWFLVFFFFKQKTAYEMRISDWSSDVCSSDVCSSDLLTGDTVLPKESVERMVLVKPDQTFSRALLELTSNSIVATLGNIGYAFAQVNPIPDIDRENRTVAIQLQVVPGPRVNVRRVVFKGNTRTSDEVMRREMRQFEGAWYSQVAIDRSKVQIGRAHV